MADKNPFTNFADVFKAYETAFQNPFGDDNPFTKWFADMGSNFDPQQIMKENQGRMEALARVNQEAVAAYQAQVSRQAEIFETLMASARESAAKMDVPSSPEAAKQNMDVFSDAMEKAAALMQKLSEESSAATEEVYKKIASEVEDAVQSIYKA